MTATTDVRSVVAPAAPVASDAAPAAVAPPPGHPRFPLVDSLRAIAALAVLFFHVGYLSNTGVGGFLSHGDAGVALFFAISGFLLYRPFVSVRLNGARKSTIPAYLRRRFLRIVPAYWLALTVLAIYPGLPGVFTGHFWVYYGFAQVYSDRWVLNGIGAAWTLCSEVIFYLVLPFYAVTVAAAIGRRSRRWQMWAELALLTVIAAASLAYRYHLAVDNPFDWMLNAFPTQLELFAPGMALAVISAAYQDRPLPRVLDLMARRPLIPLAGAVIAYALAARFVHGPEYLSFGGHIAAFYTGPQVVARALLYAATATGLLAVAVLGAGGRIRAALGWRLLAWLGLISYGIYLWHQPILDWLCQPEIGVGCHVHGVSLIHQYPFVGMAVIVAVCALVGAAVSYYIVERPILRFKR
ncbi:MAG TPA: acyltransferase [Solirubrobacteraceae bacterium]|nr:acyltransferase [Solirubrobacteraceae bacterium]